MKRDLFIKKAETKTQCNIHSTAQKMPNCILNRKTDNYQ